MITVGDVVIVIVLALVAGAVMSLIAAARNQ